MILTYLKKIIPTNLFKKIQPIYHFILAWISALFYNFPSNKLIVIGVTGTTGKTSIAYLIARALEAAGWPTGYSSTTQFSDGQREWINDKKMTMPGRFFLQKLLHRMIKNSCRFAVIETTSQGIEQFRHRFINYDVVVFSNLYPEHIEAHGSFENYKNAKAKLFKHLKNCSQKYVNDGKQIIKPKTALVKLDLDRVKKTIIVNAADEHAPFFASFKADKKLALIKEEENSLKDSEVSNIETFLQKDIKTDIDGTSFNLADNFFNLKLFGDFQADNASLAALTAFSQGASWESIKTGLNSVSSLAGKMEKIDLGQDFTVIVDYAFEPVAMEKLYDLLKVFPFRRLIHVLGSAGGGRDESRRPELGKLAGERADVVIISNEDPYDDDPRLIIEQISTGAIIKGKKENDNLFKILDRREAIAKALSMAKSQDLVLVTGKGAEQYICVKDNKKIPWDDRRVLRQELEKILEKTVDK